MKGMNWFINRIIVILLLTTAISCGQRAEYDRLIDRELASGEKNDSLFLGLRLGMTQDEFFDHCTELNRQQLITQGNRGLTVKYWVSDLKHPATMYFYPGFYNGRIYKLPGYYEYDSFTPGPVSPYSSDSLQIDVLQMYTKIYGDEYVTISHSTKGDAFILMDGNRHITIFKVDDRRVGVVFKDYILDTEIADNNDTLNVVDPLLF